MSYETLVRRSWKSGDFFLRDGEACEKAASGVAPALARESIRRIQRIQRIQREMEEIAKREAAEAAPCLCAHREGIMKLAPFVKFREEKFGAVLFETRSEKVYTLSPTGAAVVREVLSGADAKTLAERLKGKYEDTSGSMEKEALDFLAQLREKGLVTE